MLNQVTQPDAAGIAGSQRTVSAAGVMRIAEMTGRLSNETEYWLCDGDAACFLCANSRNVFRNERGYKMKRKYTSGATIAIMFFFVALMLVAGLFYQVVVG